MHPVRLLLRSLVVSSTYRSECRHECTVPPRQRGIKIHLRTRSAEFLVAFLEPGYGSNPGDLWSNAQCPSETVRTPVSRSDLRG